MWEYDHYTDAALFYDYGLVDVDLTGVIAEFGDGYFRFTTGDASTIDGLLLEMAGGSSTEDGPEPLELDAAGALVTEGGRVRLLPTRLSVSVGVPAVFGQEYAQVLLPTAALGVDCSGDQATLTTPKGSTLSLTRRADLRPTPPQQTPTPPPRDPALDCLAGIWIETDRAIPAADTSVTERGARWWFGDGLFGFDYPWYVAGTVHGVDARGTLGGAYDQGPYLEDRSSITLDGGWGEGGWIAFFDASGAALEGDFAQFRNDDHFAVECAGDRATLTSDGGTTIALQRDPLASGRTSTTTTAREALSTSSTAPTTRISPPAAPTGSRFPNRSPTDCGAATSPALMARRSRTRPSCGSTSCASTAARLRRSSSACGSPTIRARRRPRRPTAWSSTTTRASGPCHSQTGSS